MFNTHKRRKHFHISKIKEIGLIRLILALGLAAVDTVWAVYMESFNLSESMIGFISAFLLITSLIAALTTTPILEKLREYKVLILSMIITIIALLSLTITKSLWIFLTEL
jgi:MFS family permease